jgi:hypothetical protein
MNCLESQQLLQQYLDGESIDHASLDAHLRACADCAGLHAAAQRLQEGLRLRVPLAVPAGLRERTVAAVIADRRSRRRRRLLAGLALAASLLLAALAGYYGLWRTEETSPLDQPAPVVRTPEPAPPSLRDSMTEAGTAVVSLTRRTTDETVTQTIRLWPGVTPPALDNTEVLTQPLDPPARSLREAGQGVSAGLEPVASSARRAVGMFLRELPPMGAEDKPGF